MASARPSVLRWSLRFARPVKGTLAALAGLSLLEILLRALTPWALKALIDYVLVGQPLPAAFAALVASLTGGSRVRLLVVVVLGGFLIQLLHQAVLMVHTRLQAGLAQRMFSMRQLLFTQVQGLSRYRLGALRRHVAVVLQEAVLMSGTIADNIRYGRLDATDEEVRAAAVAAHADDFIRRLPRGYDTMMEAAGAGLSGGERQRLSVARAFLKDAPVLIMDEPTSALDALSEELIFDALRQLRQGRTTFVIAHRLSTVRDADRILVLEEGRLVGEGTHDELERDNALYRDMCQQLALRPAPFVERRRGGRRTSDG